MFWRKKKKGGPGSAGKNGPHDGSRAGSGSDGLDGDLEDGDTGEADLSGSGDTRFLTGDSEVDQRSVEVLLEAIAGVSEARDLQTLLTDIVDRSIEVTGAERGLLVLEKGDGSYEVRVARTRERQDIQTTDGELRFSTSVVGKVLETQRPVRATVQSDSDALELGRSVFDLKLRAVMCVPMSGKAPSGNTGDGQVAVDGGSRGVLYVDSRAATREFQRRDLGLFDALSQHISIALEQARLNLESVEKLRLENSLEVASAIQSGLMPRIPDDVPGFELHGWYKPAERTSGDFFDFVKTKKSGLAVVVGDVAGHGIGPALVTATAQASLRSYLKVLPDIGSAVTMLNADLSERTEDGMFLTLFVMSLASDGEISWINAGHHAPLLWRKASETFEAFDDHTMALGYVDDLEYNVDVNIRLERGDVLVAFTDGLIESHNLAAREDLFGEERARDVVGRLAKEGAPAEKITADLAEAALSFAGSNHDDDITLVVVKRD